MDRVDLDVVRVGGETIVKVGGMKLTLEQAANLAARLTVVLECMDEGNELLRREYERANE